MYPTVSLVEVTFAQERDSINKSVIYYLSFHMYPMIQYLIDLIQFVMKNNNNNLD